MRLEPSSGARRAVRIGLTPLIDVVFLLLIFFMLASTLIETGALTVTTAEGAAGAAPEVGTLLVRIGRDGGIELEGRRLGPAALERVLARRVQAEPALRVQVQPHADAALASLVTVLDRVAAAGVRNVQLRR